jgi:hypothetical protein
MWWCVLGVMCGGRSGDSSGALSFLPLLPPFILISQYGHLVLLLAEGEKKKKKRIEDKICGIQ